MAPPEGVVRSLTEAREFHLADCRFRNLSKATIQAYGNYERDYLTWLAANGKPLTLNNLNRQNVKDAAEWIHHRHGGKRSGEATKRQFVGIMKCWSALLADENIIEADYLARLRRPQMKMTAQRPYESWEIQALYGAFTQQPATSTRNMAMLALMLDTGVRIAELVGLTMDYLDLEAQKITVMGKGGKQRTINFGSDDRGGGKTTRLLRDYLRVRNPRGKTDVVFLGYFGQPLQTGGFYAAFVRAAEAAGITDAHPHRTRHTMATFWLVREWTKAQDGRGITLLRRLLGHISKDTYELYTAYAAEIIESREGRGSLSDEWLEPPKARAIRERYILPDNEAPPRHRAIRALPSKPPPRTARTQSSPQSEPLVRNRKRAAKG